MKYNKRINQEELTEIEQNYEHLVIEENKQIDELIKMKIACEEELIKRRIKS